MLSSLNIIILLKQHIASQLQEWQQNVFNNALIIEYCPLADLRTISVESRTLLCFKVNGKLSSITRAIAMIPNSHVDISGVTFALIDSMRFYTAFLQICQTSVIMSVQYIL